MQRRKIRNGALVTAVLLCSLILPGVMASPSASADPPISYPSLRIEMPTNNISIATPTQSTRVLDFTHITWNAGPGPLEFQPTYDSSTGTSTAVQNLYTNTGGATWAFVRSVPIVKPLVWHPPTDYAFPFSGFGLYTVGAGGGIGTLVASSPKVNFCMEGDVKVGGVPNTTDTSSPAESNCNNPNGLYGLSVGWGDEYSYPDTGNNIDISNLANGTYWLRGQADPYGYFQQTGPDESVTDTELQITGTTVTVLQQVTPTISRPVVTITNPTNGSLVPGPVTLQASVADSATVQSVQFIVDGAPLGAPVTTGGPTYSLSVSSLPPGQHIISAQAVDSNQLTGTAPAVSITTPTTVGNVEIDQQISATASAGSAATTAVFSTSASNEVLLAMVAADTGSAGQTASVTGAGLTWTLVKRANSQLGDAEIWSATSSAPLSNVTVTATPTQKKGVFLSVVALQNAAGIGASVAGGAKSGAPSVTLTAQGSGSVAFGVGQDYDHAASRTVGPNQSLLAQSLATTGDTYWSQYTTTAGPAAGQSITVNDTAPTSDRWDLAAVEIEAANVAQGPPAVAITSPTAGQSVSGTITLSANATAQGSATVSSVQFLVDNQPFGAPDTSSPYQLSLDTTTLSNGAHSVSATVTDSNNAVAGATPVGFTVANTSPTFTVAISAPKEGHTVSGLVNITSTVTSVNPVSGVQYYLNGLPLGSVQTVAPYTLAWDTKTANNGFNTLVAVATDSTSAQATSPNVTVMVSNITVCFNIDVNVVSTGRGPQTTAPFNTGLPGELLLAFVGADGTNGANAQTATVSGGGLTWTLVSRANGSPGDAEIWEATAPAALTGAQITATPKLSRYDVYLNVVAIQGAGGVGAFGSASGAKTAPAVSLTTTQPQSLIFGVGDDWDKAVARTPDSNQVLLQQVLDTSTGDTYWTQQLTLQTGAAGSVVKLDDTAPTTDRWNFASVEVLAATTSNYQP
jgi:hypothetical protein